MSANKLITHTQEILALNPTGRDCTELAKRYDVCYVTMWKFLKKHGVEFNKETLTGVEQEQMLKEYAEGTRMRILGQKYGVTRLTIRNYILRHKVERLPQFRKSTINHNFFKALTVDSLWALGWFYTDGNVSRSTNHFSVVTHRQDEEVLIKLKNVMGIDADAIYRPDGTRAWSFYGCDATIHADLVSLGCVPKKSLIVRYPSQLTEPWQHWAFLRGVLEGDGHISLKSDGNRPGFVLDIASGSKPFLKSIQAILKNLLDINAHIKIRPKEDKMVRGKVAHFSETYRLVILGGREPIMRFLNVIYENGDAKNYLDRKFKTYLKMKEIMQRKPANAYINRDKQIEAYFLSPANIVYHIKGICPFAREMNLTESIVRNILKGSKSRTGWSIPTPSQISAARASGTLIEKFY